MGHLPRLRRGKKKSELGLPEGDAEVSRVSVTARVVTTPALAAPSAEDAARAHGIDPAAAAAVLGETATPEETAAPAESGSTEEEGEENIYEVMKQHMRRKQEEIEAKNAQIRAQRTGGGRPAPAQPAAPAGPLPVEKAGDLSDLNGVWRAARNYLLANARMLESVLGGCTRVTGLTTDPAEVVLEVPKTQERFTNDKARAKLEEALRSVTELPLRLRVEFVDPPRGVTPAGMQPGGPGPSAPAATAQRVPPEVIEAVKKQPIVQELMKKLDATVTQVEMLGTGEE